MEDVDETTELWRVPTFDKFNNLTGTIWSTKQFAILKRFFASRIDIYANQSNLVN